MPGSGDWSDTLTGHIQGFEITDISWGVLKQ